MPTLGEFRELTRDLPDSTEIVSVADADDLADLAIAGITLSVDDDHPTCVLIDVVYSESTDEEETEDGHYRVAIYWVDEEGMKHPVGIWSGHAETRKAAREAAYDEFEDGAITSWESEILDFSEADPDDEDKDDDE